MKSECVVLEINFEEQKKEKGESERRERVYRMTSLDFRKMLLEAKQGSSSKPKPMPKAIPRHEEATTRNNDASDYSVALEEGLDDDGIDELELEDNSRIVLFDPQPKEGIVNPLDYVVGTMPTVLYIPNYFSVTEERNLLEHVRNLSRIQFINAELDLSPADRTMDTTEKAAAAKLG